MHRPVLLTTSLCVAIAISGCPGSTPGTDPDDAPAHTPAASEPNHTISTAPDDESVSAPETLIRFHDVTASSGVDFTYRNGEEAGHFSILESLGGGAAVFDSDRDGDWDLYLPGGGGFGSSREILGRPPALYRNLGGWRFLDVTPAARAGQAPFYSHGAAAADFDHDGFIDLLITGYGGLLLLRNQGDGTFVEVTEQAGLADDLWSASAAWGDVDGDAHPDLYVAHYVNWSFDNHPFCEGPEPGQREVCPPREFDPQPDHLYISNGDGTFRETSQEAGLAPAGPGAGKGLGAVMGDVDSDGDLDIYVGNDTVPNFLYRNHGDGTFQDVSLVSGTSLSDRGMPDGSMGVDLGDFNLDGLPDIWVANYERESFALYRNEGDCFFRPVSDSVGVTAVGGLYVGWGTVFADFDLDADEDLFVSNGHVIRYPTSAPLRQQPLLFQNEAGRRLVNVAASAGPYLASAHMGRGVAAGDLDRDGDVDLVVSHVNEPAALLENRSDVPHGWIAVRLIGTHSSRDAVGAAVTVELSGGRTMIRQWKGGGSYASTSTPDLHFGLGDAEIERVVVRWPSGREQEFHNLAERRRHVLVEPRDG